MKLSIDLYRGVGNGEKIIPKRNKMTLNIDY